MAGVSQVFVAPGPDDELLTATDLPWLAGRAVVLPAPQWQLVVMEGALLHPRAAAELERVSGDFAYDSDPEFQLRDEELAALVRFLTDLGAHLAERRAFTAEPPQDLEFLLDIDDYVGMVELVRLVFEESLRTGLPFRAWVEV
ncbi:MAG: hypothetical protein JWR58_6864 [Pseudonocardia sp.]|jgi:hypothetical protein|nr:hypothetical protein [Pseudonocardia sp.]